MENATRCLLIMILIASQVIVYAIPSPMTTSSASTPLSARHDTLTDLLTSINYSRIWEHVSILSNLGSRVTGYEGCYKASEYIESYFRRFLGEKNVIVQEYDVVVPIDDGANISVLINGNRVLNIDAYNLWPNLIVTGIARDLGGPLVYVGKGDLADFNGKRISGSIVLMDFNSGGNWLNAAKFGAKAVIFIEPEDTTKFEAFSKFLNTPINFPRLYIRKEDARLLLNAIQYNDNVEVVINSRMSWKNVKAKNVIGIVNGTEYPSDIIVVAAHYDTWSVVPKLAPGADEAASVAALLELARWFAKNRPRFTVWFVALSGHWQALAGAREFTERFFFDPNVTDGKTKMWVFIALDLSTDTGKVAFLYRGHMYDFGASGPMLRWISWLQPRIFNVYLPMLTNATGRAYNVRDGFHPSGMYGWWASVPEPYMLDSEPWAVAHGLSFTVRTDETFRPHWGTPLSNLRYVNLDNLRPQLEVAAAVIFGLANEQSIGIAWSSVAPSRYLFTAAGGDIAGFMTVRGKVWTFDISKGWYSNVPGALVVACRVGVAFSSYPFSRIIAMTDDQGNFEIRGISGYGYGHGYGIVDVWRFEAYRLNDETGVIEYAPDLGQYGAMQVTFTYQINRHPYEVTTVVFRATTIELFDVIDASAYRPYVFMNPIFKNTNRMWTGRPWSLTLLDSRDLSQPIAWGSVFNGYESVATLFLPHGAKGLLILRSGSEMSITGLLVNSTPVIPEGEGLGGERSILRINFTPYYFARDMLSLSSNRYEELKRFGMRNPVIEFFIDKAKQHLEKAERYYLELLLYDKAQAEALAAWSYAIMAYSNVMSTIYDTVNTGLIIFLVLLFFSLFFERLTIGAYGVRAMFSIATIFTFTFLVYINLHPASKVAANILIGPLSLTSLLLFIITIAIFYDKLKIISREFREKTVGVHIIERTPVSSLIGVAMTQAPRNIRAHPIRSALIFFTIGAVIFSMVALSSISPTIEAKDVLITDVTPAYQGLLVKRSLEYAPDVALDSSITYLIDALTGGKALIVPRAWVYPPSVGGEGVYTLLNAGNRSYPIKAFIGMTPHELRIIKESLLEGVWFSNADYMACIIPRQAAKALNVTVGDVIEVFSQKLVVKGIFEPEILNRLMDFDKYTMTPADPSNIQAITIRPVETQVTTRIPLSWDQVIIIPYNLALDWGGLLASVTIVSGDKRILTEAAKSLALLLKESKILYAVDEQVYMPSPVGWFNVAGMEFVLVPLVIASLNIASIMLASVKEREREIKVWSSVGLAPSGTILVFVTEAAIYALIGCVFGYFLGIIVNVSLFNLRLLPENFTVNYTSTATLLGIGIPIAATIISAILPAYNASRLITPSLERKWKITTRPRGDIWEIPLPFGIEKEAEVLGVLEYLGEYLSSRTIESEDPFIVQEVRVNLAEHIVEATMQLIPLESGVWQRVQITATRAADRWELKLIIERKTGMREVWTSQNYRVVDALRKQLLLWRSLAPTIREQYIQKALQIKTPSER